MKTYFDSQLRASEEAGYKTCLCFYGIKNGEYYNIESVDKDSLPEFYKKHDFVEWAFENSMIPTLKKYNTE